MCKVPSTVANFIPPNDVVFHNRGKSSQRNIFKHQKFTDREIEKLRRLTVEIKKNKIKIPSD